MAAEVFDEESFEEDTYIYLYVLPSERGPAGVPLLLRRPEPRVAPFEEWLRVGGLIRRPVLEEAAAQLFIRREFTQEMRFHARLVKRFEEYLRAEAPVYTEEAYRMLAEAYEEIMKKLEEKDEVS